MLKNLFSNKLVLLLYSITYIYLKEIRTKILKAGLAKKIDQWFSNYKMQHFYFK